MITVIPIAGIFVAGVLVFFFFYWNHRQRMAQIERGMKPELPIDIERFSLLVGLLSTAVGLVLTLVAFLARKGTYGLLGGLITLAAGIGFLLYYKIAGSQKDR
jgi:hypothetical protein